MQIANDGIAHAQPILRALRVEVIFRNVFNVICPVQPGPHKHSSFLRPQIICVYPPSRPGRGALAIVTNVGTGSGGRGSVVAHGSAGRVFGFREHGAGAETSDAEAYGEAVWFWHPLLVSNRRWCCRPTGSGNAVNPAMTVTKRNSSPGRARRKPLKPSRRECRVSGEPVVTTVCYHHFAHGLRVQRAPGISLRLLFLSARVS